MCMPTCNSKLQKDRTKNFIKKIRNHNLSKLSPSMTFACLKRRFTNQISIKHYKQYTNGNWIKRRRTYIKGVLWESTYKGFGRGKKWPEKLSEIASWVFSKKMNGKWSKGEGDDLYRRRGWLSGQVKPIRWEVWLPKVVKAMYTGHGFQQRKLPCEGWW